MWGLAVLAIATVAALAHAPRPPLHGSLTAGTNADGG